MNQTKLRNPPLRLFKVLNGLKSCHGGSHTWTIGEWVEVSGELIPCENGIHLCREQDLVHWLGKDIYEAEYDGKMVETEDKIVVRRARITNHLSNWNERTARLFACWCARQVAHLNNDERVLAAIKTAERYANGLVSKKELSSASAAARDAARAAASAASAAAWGAASAAAKATASAASAAAWDAASAAAREAQTKKLMEVLYGSPDQT
jgi:hypothetical protein